MLQSMVLTAAKEQCPVKDDQPLSRDQLNTIRQRIWNKSLATVVIDVRGDTAVALPVRRLKNAQEHLDL